MRRIYSATLAAFTGLVMVASSVTVGPAAQAATLPQMELLQESCTSPSFAVKASNFTEGRDNTGHGKELLRVDVTDIWGLPLAFFEREREITPPFDDITFFPQKPQGRLENPLRATLTSLAGNDLEEQRLGAAELYCANLPGSILGTYANHFHPDAAVVKGPLATSVKDLSGSPLSFSKKTNPEVGVLDVAENGEYTYAWDKNWVTSFDVTVRNAAGMEIVLPVTLQRSRSPQISIAASVTRLASGDPLSISTRVGHENAAPTPMGTVTFTRHEDSHSWNVPVDDDGWAELVLEDLPVGGHNFNALYNGDSEYKTAMSSWVEVTVVEKEDPGTGEPECAEGESLNDEGECVNTGTGGEGGVGENLKPNPLPDTDKNPVTQGVEKPAKAVPAPIANTGAENTVWLAGVSVLVVAAGVSLVARRRRT